MVADPFGYGRIVRDDEGDVEAIVEEKDATPEQRGDPRDQLAASSPSTREFLAEALPRIGNDNAKGEYYLTDVVGARPRGRPDGRCATASTTCMQTEGANDRVQLADARPRAEPPHPRRAGCATA